MNAMVLNQSVAIATVVLSVLSILLLCVGARVDQQTKRSFISFYTLLILFALANLAGQLLRNHPGPGYRIGLYISNYCEFLLSGMLACVGGHYVLSMVDPEQRHRIPRIILWTLMGLHLVLLTLSQFTGLLYTIDSANAYHRAPWYPLALAGPGGMLLLGCFALLRYGGQIPRRQKLPFLSFLVIPLLAVVLQNFFYGVYIVLLSTVVALFLMFLFVVSDQNERYYRQEQENAQLKVNLLLSQIQPHFLYNSLTVIRELIRTDPVAAEGAVDRFSVFLRHNMRSIDSDRPIPFRQELEHAKSYLALQQLRFGRELQVVYDLECQDFSLPTLTLQPIVENAVSHGIRESATGVGTVTIQTRELPDRYELRVLDDGAGFDPAELDRADMHHLGIRNVRARLSRICGGRLELNSQPGKGTVAVIVLPKEGTSC